MTGRLDKLLAEIENNARDVRFSNLCTLLKGYGFILDHVRGSHHIFKHPGIKEIANIQEVKGRAKPYQVRQVLKLIERIKGGE